MAAIFQLRRGSGSVSLVDGELYLHKSSGSLQVSLGDGNPITLARLDQINSGSLKLSGDLTASNAYFSGDVAISGNLYLGNNTSDNINALGVFTSDLKPGTSNLYNIGTTSAVWANVYANSVSASSFTGSISGSVNGVDFTNFSSSVDSRLDNIQDFTSSITTALSQSVTGSINKLAYFNRNNVINSYPHAYLTGSTFGLGTDAFTGYQPETLMVDGGQSFNIATFQTSQNNSFAEVNIKNFGSGSNSSADLVLWNDVTTEESGFVDLGINSSNYSAGELAYSGDGYLVSSHSDLYVGAMNTGSHGHLHMFGGRLWDSSSISIYNDGTIGIHVDKLNNSASTIPTAGYMMEIAGDVIFDNNIDIIGNISSSTISGIGNVTIYSTSVDTRFNRLEESTQSLNDYTQSLKSAIDVSGGNTRIIGNLVVDGTQTSLNTTNVYIEDFKITLASGSATSLDANGAGFEIAGANVSMSWEHSNTKFGINTNLGVAGEISSSTISGLGNANEFALGIQSSTASLNTFSASMLGHISDINTKTGSFENKFTTIQNVTASFNLHTASLNTYSQSVNGHIIDLNSWTASQNEKDLIISGITASYDFFTGSATASIVSLFGTASNHEIRIDDLEAKSIALESYTSSIDNKFTILESVTASYNIHTASLNTFTSSTYSTFSTSVDLRLDQLEYTTSILTPEGQAEAFNALNNFTSSANNRLNNLELTTASLNIFSSSASSRLNDLESHTASYATTGSNTFVGNQIISGSTYVTGDLIVYGSSSLQNITASAVSLGTNIIYLNTDNPAVRFAGLSVYDSGSTETTGSLLYDSQNERWIYQKASGSLYSGGMLISGPRNTGSLGDEIGMPTNKLIMGVGGDHISSSGIYHNGTDTAFGGNLEVTGSTILGTVNIVTLNAGNGIVSGSSQITISDTIGFTSFSSSLDDRFDTIEIYTSSNDLVNNLQTIRIDQLAAGTASVNTFTQSVNEHISDINSYTSSIKTALSVSGTDVVIAGNLTVLGDTVTLNVGNLLVEDKTIVIASGSTSSILSDGAGLYISGADASILWNHLNNRIDINKSINVAGDITLSGTIDGVDVSGHVLDINAKTGSFESKFGTIGLYTASLDSHIVDINAYTASNDTTNLTQNNRLSRIEESTASLNLFTSSINTTIKTKLNVDGVISGSSQITYGNISGLPTNVVSASTDSNNIDFTIVNGNITANLFGGVVSGSSQVTLSSTTGGGTSSNVQFGSLGIGTAASGISGEIRATGDITAFYSSDIRLKENIIPITNALEKVNQISGNTYDWKEGFEEIHSHKGNDVGVIAQEIENILPQLVTNRDTGYKAVQYEKLIPLLIEAIKELSAKVDRLENK
jgi:hypothetical protein